MYITKNFVGRTQQQRSNQIFPCSFRFTNGIAEGDNWKGKKKACGLGIEVLYCIRLATYSYAALFSLWGFLPYLCCYARFESALSSYFLLSMYYQLPSYSPYQLNVIICFRYFCAFHKPETSPLTAAEGRRKRKMLFKKTMKRMKRDTNLPTETAKTMKNKGRIRTE